MHYGVVVSMVLDYTLCPKGRWFDPALEYYFSVTVLSIGVPCISLGNSSVI